MNNWKHRTHITTLFLVFVVVILLLGCSSQSLVFVTPIPTFTITPTTTPTRTPTLTPTTIPTPLGGGGRFVLGSSELYVINVDGSGLTNLTNNPADDGQPTWSPYGNKVAFTSNRAGNYDIYVMNDDGSDVINLTNSPIDDFSPHWSPDDTTIAFTSGRYGGQYIYSINSDGTELTKLTKQAASIYSLDWSPNGASIVYDSGPLDYMARQDHTDILIMNVDGSGVINITNDLPDDIWPSWSPDGTKISFVSNRDTERDSQGRYDRHSYIMNSDGSDLIRLINVGRGPATWSPDGTKIAMIAGFDGDLSIYILNADFTSGIRSISLPKDFEWVYGIDWSPH